MSVWLGFLPLNLCSRAFAFLACLTPRSKKAAKHEAAGAALRSFVQFKDTCEVQAAIRK
jgi:hypothetical protein